MKTIGKKTPEALECTHILGTTAEQVVVKWSNARPGGINFRQMPALASSAGLSMGSSLRIGFEKKISGRISPNFFPPPDSSGEMPAEEAMPAYTEIIVSQMPGGGMIAVGFDSYIISG